MPINPFIWGNPASFGQQTPAAQIILAQASGRTGGLRSARKRRKKARAAAPSRKRRSAKRGRPARLVKGSRAAKAYMAKIRRKRK